MNHPPTTHPHNSITISLTFSVWSLLAGEELRCDAPSLSGALTSEFMLELRLCLSEVGESGGVCVTNRSSVVIIMRRAL